MDEIEKLNQKIESLDVNVKDLKIQLEVANKTISLLNSKA